SGRGRKNRRGRNLIVWELADDHPIMRPESKIPSDKLATDVLEERRDCFLAVFGLGQHALNRICRELASRNVDGHGITPVEAKAPRPPSHVDEPLYACKQSGARH